MIAQNPLDSLLALVASVFDAYSVVLFQAEDGDRAARLVASFSLDDHINDHARIPPGKGLVGWILRNNSPLLVEAMEENQTYLGYYRDGREPDIRSFMGCPLPGGGALCIDSKRRHAFADNRQKLLHLFALMIPQLQPQGENSGAANEASGYFVALERMAGLRGAYTGWNPYLKRLLDLLLEATGFQYAAFASRAENSDRYQIEGESPPLLNRQGSQIELPMQSGIVGWVLRNGEPVLHEGGEAVTPVFGKHPLVPDFACSMCLPVVMDKSVCGVLCLAGMEPRAFSRELRSFARMAADDMARLLETLSLRYRIHHLLPKATLQTEGGVAFDPDAQPAPRTPE